jgi:hypothetical protein
MWSNRDEKEVNVRTLLGEVDYSSGEMKYNNSSDKNKLLFYKENDVSKLKPLN